MKPVFFMTAVLLAASPASAQAPSAPTPPAPPVPTTEKIKLAVVPSIAVNIEAARVDALSQDLAEALMSELEIDAIGGLEVRRKLPVEGLPADCVANDPCVAAVAARLGADQLLFVVMVDTGNTGTTQIDSTWVDPANKKRASRPPLDLAHVADARAKFTANARRLLPDAPVRKKPAMGSNIGGAMTPEVPRHFTTPAKIAVGSFALGLGVGLGFGLAAGSRYDACQETACTDERKDSIRTLSLVADIGHVVWIGSAIAVATLYLTSGRESKFVVAPTGDGGMSAAMVGRF
ncbi:MAG: hypothetical protein SFX73_13210 [Kofleriaceae bacterium]|nr:hypothetical protein [Kofleriaceae bacterium]